jgi:hypothetical protein
VIDNVTFGSPASTAPLRLNPALRSCRAVCRTKLFTCRLQSSSGLSIGGIFSPILLSRAVIRVTSRFTHSIPVRLYKRLQATDRPAERSNALTVRHATKRVRPRRSSGEWRRVWALALAAAGEGCFGDANHRFLMCWCVGSGCSKGLVGWGWGAVRRPRWPMA